MSEFKITWVGANYAKDVTATLAGVNNNLPEPERTEMTNEEKFISFWDAVDKALAKKYAKEKEDGNKV